MPDEALIERLLPALRQRGPDYEATHVEPYTGFGHCRLSIIDLSPAAHQPMKDPELDLVISYNGEIYNYPELRKDLQGRGYRFFSNSDTEVILKAYHAWGDRFVEAFNGMFAFCLYDRKQRRWVLGRDRLGIKPLYFVDQGDKLYFASNIQALSAAGVVDGELSPEALHYYLSFHSVVPPPHTIFANVEKLEPATLLTIEADGSRRKTTYWDVSFGEKLDLTEEEWIERILHSLRRAVRLRLVSDVPVGALLSGGVDSSLIVGLMAKETDWLRTYSIGFETVGEEEGNEFVYSDAVAEKFQTEHRKIFIEASRLLPALPDCVAAMAEPMASHDAIGFYLLSEEVSKETKVVLSGQGADELFAGYHWYPKVMDSTGDPVLAYKEAFFDRDHQEVLEALDPAMHPDRDFSLEFVRESFGRCGTTEPVDKALLLDTRVMLIDDPVKRVDNMTMAWGLEGRVPFLDHRNVELVAKIPAELKVKEGGKHILKKAAERVIPREVIYRKKGYFPVPALKYLQGETLELAREVLTSDAARQRGLFRREYVDKLLAEPEEHIAVLGGSKLWQITVLEYWLQQLGV